MKYVDFKSAVRTRLSSHPSGMTWKQLRDDLSLPYDKPCPEWTRRLEQEIHLVRSRGAGNALVWALNPAGKR